MDITPVFYWGYVLDKKLDLTHGAQFTPPVLDDKPNWRGQFLTVCWRCSDEKEFTEINYGDTFSCDCGAKNELRSARKRYLRGSRSPTKLEDAMADGFANFKKMYPAKSLGTRLVDVEKKAFQFYKTRF